MKTSFVLRAVMRCRVLRATISLCLALGVVAAASTNSAYAKESPYFVAVEAEPPFAPVVAYVLFEYEQPHPAVKVEAKTHPIEDASGRRIIVGAYTPNTRNLPRSLSVLLLGKRREDYYFVPPMRFQELVRTTVQKPLELRQLILDRRARVEELRGQRKALERQLERLESDAGVIANIQRISQLQSEVRETREEAESLNRYAQSLERFVALAGGNELPRSFDRRQSELTRQVAELVRVARSAEQNADQARAKLRQDDAHRDAMVRLAQERDIEELQRELMSLRVQREQLERRQP